jgi:acylphosphatase
MTGEGRSERYTVRGRVQGVGFRAWSRRLARELGVRGWVRNRPDGSVELHAAGTDEAMTELVQRLEKGPPVARVEAVEREGSAQDLPKSGFEVRW